MFVLSSSFETYYSENRQCQHPAACWKSERTPNLEMRLWWWWPVRGLVKMSGSWEIEGTKCKEISPTKNCWRTKWQSSSTCLVRSWKTEFFAMWMADLLSECRGMGKDGEMVRSESRRTSQVSSATTRRIDRYSASAEDREMKGCFFGFPRNWSSSDTNEIATNRTTRFRTRSPVRVAVG